MRADGAGGFRLGLDARFLKLVCRRHRPVLWFEGLEFRV